MQGARYCSEAFAGAEAALGIRRMKFVKTNCYGLMTKDHRLLGEVFESRDEAEARARELGPGHVVVVLVDVIR